MHLGRFTTSGVLKLLRLIGQDAARTASLQQRGSVLRLLALQLHEADAAVPLQRRATRELLTALFRRPADGAELCNTHTACSEQATGCEALQASDAISAAHAAVATPSRRCHSTLTSNSLEACRNRQHYQCCCGKCAAAAAAVAVSQRV